MGQIDMHFSQATDVHAEEVDWSWIDSIYFRLESSPRREEKAKVKTFRVQERRKLSSSRGKRPAPPDPYIISDPKIFQTSSPLFPKTKPPKVWRSK